MKALTKAGDARIYDVQPEGFAVAEPWAWVDVPEDTTQHDTCVDGAVVKYATPQADITEAARISALRADPQRAAMVNALLNATPAQIDNYMDANVTDLASARAMLKRLAKLMAVAIRQLK